MFLFCSKDRQIDCECHEDLLELAIVVDVAEVVVSEMDGIEEFGWELVVFGDKAVFQALLHFGYYKL
jgi:hypothetical protein